MNFLIYKKLTKAKQNRKYMFPPLKAVWSNLEIGKIEYYKL